MDYFIDAQGYCFGADSDDGESDGGDQVCANSRDNERSIRINEPADLDANGPYSDRVVSTEPSIMEWSEDWELISNTSGGDSVGGEWDILSDDAET
jgi:hypothetical protein